MTPSHREELILSHMPQVKLIAYRLHRRCPQVEFDDLMSVGTIGFIQAVDCARICAQKSAHQGNLRKRSCRNETEKVTIPHSSDKAIPTLGHRTFARSVLLFCTVSERETFRDSERLTSGRCLSNKAADQQSYR
jgi:hypothetical protein